MISHNIHGMGRVGRILLLVAVLLLTGTVALFGQLGKLADDPAGFDRLAKGTSILDPANGKGMMVAGELWDSFMPANMGPYYTEAARDVVFTFVRIGNFDRAWSSPTHMWPGGFNFGQYWGKGFYMAEWNPSATFNPATVAGKANPCYDGTAGPNYAIATYGNKVKSDGTVVKVLGAGVAARDYAKETKWVDAAKRHHALYEAGWPTNIGVDVQMKIHQFSLNWNNFNDFIIVEFKLTNTGKKDINCDGVAEDTSNVIHALTMLAHGEYMSCYGLNRSAGRGNYFGAQRMVGYIGDNDPKGSPWDISVGFPGESAAGVKDMGLNNFPNRWYTDIWTGWSWLGAKKADGTDKPTIFNTHPIGTGDQRGWYASAGQGRGIGVGAGATNGRYIHTAAMGTFYKDGGKSRDAAKFDLSPDPNFFASGTAGNPETFVVKAGTPTPATRPRGDRKLLSEEAPTSAFEFATYEAGFVKGFAGPDNFDGDQFNGIGPFNLAVGESVTITWAEYGGYRFQGLTNAAAAARWAYDRRASDYATFDAALDFPPVPAVKVDNTFSKTVKVRWDNKAEAYSKFAGYKVYKASLAQQVDFLATGMRGVDDYWKNTTPGATPSSLLKPVNPSFSAQAFVAGRFGVPDTWGPYELVAIIPSASKGTYADASVAGFNYAWEDKTVDLGFKYWYYVSAYTAESPAVDLGATYSGTNPATTTTLETPNINRNGASGLWLNTYPFADLNTFFPKTGDLQAQMGAGFTVRAALAQASKLAAGEVKISVKPNPYKKKALFDNATDAFDHKVVFYNLPGRAKITILDVSGQVIKVIDFSSADPNNGSTFWDLFSKDGIEVASGLYIYVVEYDGGQHVGYLSVLR